MLINSTRLAADYSAAIRRELSELQLFEVRRRNAAERDPEIDHIHDFIDPADCMADAMNAQRPAWNWNDHADEIADAMATAKAAGYGLSRILIACEWSGKVRDAMAAYGHDVMSCDVLPSARPGQHYQGDVRDILADGWHRMIAFPPCTYLASCQLWRCLPKHDPTRERQKKSDEALQFVRDLFAAPIHHKAIENPRGRIGTAIRPADQEIHPYQFGHDVSKTTGIWLEYLDKLRPDPADYIPPKRVTYRGKIVNRWGNQSPCGADKRGPSSDRGHLRGETYDGIADAMAAAWNGIKKRIKPTAPAVQPAQMALF